MIGTRKKPRRAHVPNVRKATILAIVVNAIEVFAALLVFFYMLIHRGIYLSRVAELSLVGFCVLIVVWGAMIDIYDAFNVRRITLQTDMLEEAYSQLEALNGTLRSQRHDFKNHLQVVYSLTDLKEYDEALKYIERVYEDIQHVGQVLKTSIPALNALIAAKEADCADHGIQLETEITSAWNDVPVAGWELCRVFGNLIDNAREALLSANVSQPRIVIALSETPSEYTFQVRNNGPIIPEEIISNIFERGFTTKTEGHGSGLAIVSEILGKSGGYISVRSDPNETCFHGGIRRRSLTD